MGRHSSGQEAPFRLLFVCTGNICRSPLAEIFTRHLLLGRLGGRAAEAFSVSSAGVHAAVGSGMHADARAELTPWGLHEAVAERFVARQLSPAMILESDLVLGASPEHRSAVVECMPVALPIVFSLREFARLGAAVSAAHLLDLPDPPVERARALVELARNWRGMVRLPPDGDDVPDPMGRPAAAHRAAAGLIEEAALRIVDILVPVPAATRPLPVVRPAERPGAAAGVGAGRRADRQAGRRADRAAIGRP